MAKQGETRDRLLQAAANLFQAQGYHATGLNQIVATGGAPNGSHYFHFPGGKEQLAAESITLSATASAPSPTTPGPHYCENS